MKQLNENPDLELLRQFELEELEERIEFGKWFASAQTGGVGQDQSDYTVSGGVKF
jgi:hypothetical protein